MKLLALVVAALVATASVDGATNRPGSCKDDKDCTADYTCVSVQTTREGVINVKQCLPTKKGTPVCTGIIPGLCPSFSTTWGAAFRQISSVCAYILPEGKNIKCLADPTNSTKGGVECLFVQNPANTSEQLGVIYGCVDFDGQRLLFDKKSKSDKIASSFNYSEIIEKSCVNPKNPQGSTFVCSSQGTCSPSSANSMSYSCKCNIGFQGKYCEKIVNNECYHDGVCGGGSCDLVKNECKDCPPGTMGNKCAQCDPSYDATKVCGGHGKCVASSGDSTLGADGSAASSGTSSSNSTSASSGSSDSKTTKAPSKTTKAPSKTSDGSGSAMGPGSVTAPSLNRLLMSMATTNQCKCDEGWTDANCAVKVKAAASSNSSASTPAPSSAAVSVNGVAGSMVAVVSVTLAAVFSA